MEIFYHLLLLGKIIVILRKEDVDGNEQMEFIDMELLGHPPQGGCGWKFYKKFVCTIAKSVILRKEDVDGNNVAFICVTFREVILRKEDVDGNIVFVCSLLPVIGHPPQGGCGWKSF